MSESEKGLTAYERVLVRKTLRVFKQWWNAQSTSSTSEHEAKLLDLLVTYIEEGMKR